MNFSIDFFDFTKINFTIATIIGGALFILLGVIYYLIFHNHHKRNQVELFELVELVTKFYVRTIILMISLSVSVYLVIMAVYLQEDRNDVIACIALAVIIASLAIINYRYYIKISLLDYETEVREQNNKRKLKIGEILEIICLIICILAPVWRIPGFIEVFENKAKLATEIIKSFAISIGGLVLIFALNPMNIKRFLVEEERETKKKSSKNKLNKNSKNTSKTISKRAGKKSQSK